MTYLRAAAALVSLALVAGCNTLDTAEAPKPEPVSNSNVKVASLDIPTGLECGATLSAFKSVLDNDLRTGHVNRPVYDKAISDLRPSVAACQAGRNVESLALTNATKRRFGYPVASFQSGEPSPFRG